jgi:hypothetical protein
LGLRVVAAASGEDEADNREAGGRRGQGTERAAVACCALHRFSFVLRVR